MICSDAWPPPVMTWKSRPPMRSRSPAITRLKVGGNPVSMRR